MIPLSAVVLGPEEERHVLEVLRSGMLAQGPKVALLEEEFARAHGVRHALAVSNGTVALVAALRGLGVGPGDEVITSAFSFNATLNAIIEVGAVARFADVRPDFTLDPDSAAALVNERTAALLPVHLYGQAADMAALTRLAGEHGLHLVEDAAQAHGARYQGRHVGSFGVGTFSLYGTKNLTAGEGGLVTTDDDEVAARIRLLRNQGMRRRYQYETIGHNWRLTDLQAAVALPQVRRLSEITAARAANAARLTEGLRDVPGLLLPRAEPDRDHAWHQYTVQVLTDRDRFCERLTEDGIGHGVYYPRLMYDHDCYRRHPQVVADPAPVARVLTGRVISLPVHPGLSEDDLDRVVAAVRGAAAD